MLERFARALKPGGIIVINVPNPLSVKGLVTKFTPHWFHIAYYRYIRGRENAGREDNPPFPTTMRFCISRVGMRRMAEVFGLEVCYEDSLDFDIQKENKAFSIAYGVFSRISRVLSFGILGDSELTCVLRKPLS